MTRRAIVLAAAIAAGPVLMGFACVPTPPKPVISTVKYVPMPNTTAGITLCNSYPGGAPQRHPTNPTLIICRIVP